MSIFLKNKLVEWHDPHQRDLPWKSTKDPYKIWLSEVILQQTRVDQGRPYYFRFISNYPDVRALAKAPLSEVLKLWEGLGYYARARNMHFAAIQVLSQFNGVFPTRYDDLLKIKGIGPYSAAAISSFAANEPQAVLDGNVYRVLSRFFNIDVPIDTKEGKVIFKNLAESCLDRENSAVYNQAIMDFGAILCTPKKPKCDECPLQGNCGAFFSKTINVLPVKSKKLLKRERFFLYLVSIKSGKIAIQKREGKDIWEELYEFPMVEFGNIAELLDSKYFRVNGQHYVYLKQSLTHQTINGYFVFISDFNDCHNKTKVKWVNSTEISKFAFPKIICEFLEGNYF